MKCKRKKERNYETITTEQLQQIETLATLHLDLLPV